MSPYLTLFGFLVFLVGFGLLLFSLIELLMGIKQSKSEAIRTKKKSIFLRSIFFASGLVLIIISQGIFWFNSNLKVYSGLSKDIPLARISFRESETERPRMFLETFDEENQPILADEILLEDTLLQLEMEIIKFRKLGNLFGLREIYRFTRLIYVSDPAAYKEEYQTTQLGHRDESVSNFIKGIKKVIGLAYHKTILSDPFSMDTSIVLEISYNNRGILEMFSEETFTSNEESIE